MIEFETLLPLHQELLLKEETPSQLIFHDNYEIWLVRTAVIAKDALQYYTRRFIVINEKIYEFDLTTKATKLLLDRNVLYLYIEQIIHDYEHILEVYQETIELKEDALYMRKLSPLFLNEWFDLKRDITRLERILNRLTQVFSRFKRRPNHTDEWETLAEFIETQQRIASLLLARLDTLYNYASSLKNDKMNRNLYVLTILSSIFLPLNFIIGFFGMNTQNMYLKDDVNGTYHVSLAMIALVLIMLLGLPLLKWLEKMFIRRILGRFSFYRHIAKRFRTLNE